MIVLSYIPLQLWESRLYMHSLPLDSKNPLMTQLKVLRY